MSCARLMKEFETELAGAQGRVDGLEAKSAEAGGPASFCHHHQASAPGHLVVAQRPSAAAPKPRWTPPAPRWGHHPSVRPAAQLDTSFHRARTCCARPGGRQLSAISSFVAPTNRRIAGWEVGLPGRRLQAPIPWASTSLLPEHHSGAGSTATVGAAVGRKTCCLWPASIQLTTVLNVLTLKRGHRVPTTKKKPSCVRPLVAVQRLSVTPTTCGQRQPRNPVRVHRHQRLRRHRHRSDGTSPAVGRAAIYSYLQAGASAWATPFTAAALGGRTRQSHQCRCLSGTGKPANSGWIPRSALAGASNTTSYDSDQS